LSLRLVLQRVSKAPYLDRHHQFREHFGSRPLPWLNRRPTALPVRPPATSTPHGRRPSGIRAGSHGPPPRSGTDVSAWPRQHSSADAHYPAAEALAEFDTSELTTGMTAAPTHDDNSRNAVSAFRLASSSVALSPRASCLLLDSTISHPHCWRDQSVTAGLHHCSSATSTRGPERWRLAVRS
jgi:hypothetical protein